MLDSNKTLKNKNYDGIEIIKEEREIDSPFRNSGYFSKKSKTSRISLDINSNLKKEDYIENIKKGKKSLVKTKSNAMLLNKRLNINNKEKNKKMLKDTKNKTQIKEPKDTQVKTNVNNTNNTSNKPPVHKKKN